MVVEVVEDLELMFQLIHFHPWVTMPFYTKSYAVSVGAGGAIYAGNAYTAGSDSSVAYNGGTVTVVVVVLVVVIHLLNHQHHLLVVLVVAVVVMIHLVVKVIDK